MNTETYKEEAAANIGEERAAVEYERQREEGRAKQTPWEITQDIGNMLFNATSEKDEETREIW